MDFWTRAQLKTQAKDVLRRSYWMAFAVCLVAGLLGGGGSGGGGFSTGYNTSSGGFNSIDPYIMSIIVTVVMFAAVIGLAIGIFVSNPVLVGLARWFTQNRTHAKYPNFGVLFSAFNKQSYLKVVGAMAWRSLIVFLWSLLFIIPGIVKGYQYYFVPWILADNPNLHYKRAMEISRKMTDGQKGNIFILELSFLGWAILGVLACCVGVFFLTPYITATYAELYAAFRHNALTNGFCGYEELGFAPPAAPEADAGSHYQEPPQL